MDSTNLLTIVIPIRIDSDIRLSNLQTVVSFLLEDTQCSIIVLEADEISKVKNLQKSNRLQIIFVHDSSYRFHRTSYINKLLKLAQTPYVGIWDSDVLIDSYQIKAATDIMEKGAIFSLPYDGECIFLSEEFSEMVRGNTNLLFGTEASIAKNEFKLHRPSVGGAYIVNKNMYNQIGGENEKFIGWGPEDMERAKRVEILGYPIHRCKGSIFHLYHPRGINSTLGTDEKAISNLYEFVRVCSMTKCELWEYVKSNEWANSML